MVAEEDFNSIAGKPALFERSQAVGGDDAGDVDALVGPTGPGAGGGLSGILTMRGFDGKLADLGVPVIEIAIDGWRLGQSVHGELRGGRGGHSASGGYLRARRGFIFAGSIGGFVGLRRGGVIGRREK